MHRPHTTVFISLIGHWSRFEDSQPSWSLWFVEMLVWWCGDCSSVVQYLVPILFILCLRTNKFSVFWAEPTDIKISPTSTSKQSRVVVVVLGPLTGCSTRSYQVGDIEVGGPSLSGRAGDGVQSVGSEIQMSIQSIRGHLYYYKLIFKCLFWYDPT